MTKTKQKATSSVWFTLIVLFAINTMNFYDRAILGSVGEPIRKEFALGDGSLGLLSTAFTILYALVGLPLGRLVDKFSRGRIIAAGVFLWSLFTAGSGLVQTYWQVFLMRLGVGIGEASCAPAATSLISDLFPSNRRGKAISIFMLGLPVGIALSFAISGTIAQLYGWRTAFVIAGVPGILLAVVALFIREPVRGSGDSGHSVDPVTAGSPYRSILRSHTMRWLIVSGAIHNFCLYALSSFMTPYLMRYHGLEIGEASLIAMFVNGIFTLPGMLLGGFVGDLAKSWKPNGALLVSALAVAASVPFFYFGIAVPAGESYLFLILMGIAFALVYFYYASVYAAIADVTVPTLRGSAMAAYFLAMYLLGGALGPYVVGMLSDYFTLRAALDAGVAGATSAALEPFRAAGLQSAMFVLPLLFVLLSGVLFAASRTFRFDMDRLKERAGRIPE
jgi:MFS family permease